MKQLIFISYFILTFKDYKALTHQCIHNEISERFPVEFLEIEQSQDFLNLSKESSGFDQSTAQPIRIHFVTGFLKQQVRDQNQLQNFQQRDFLVNNVIQQAVDFFQSRLTINRQNSFKEQFRGKRCGEVIIPFDHDLPEADIYLFATAKDDQQSNYAAYALSCILHSQNQRPIAGQVNFNLSKLNLSAKGYNEFTKVVIHEIMHVLGFSQSLYQYYQDSNGQQFGLKNVKRNFETHDQKIVQGLITPNLLQFARKYWGCPSINYVPLEDEGGSASEGSHFERAALFNEVMTASTIKNSVFSGFSFNLLKDTGWYGIDEIHFEDIFAGKNMGCDWLKYCHSNQNNQYFCKEMNAQQCYFDYTAGGECTDFYVKQDSCKIVQAYDDMDCRDETISKDSQAMIDQSKMSFGMNSRCFMSNIIKRLHFQYNMKPACYDAYCSHDQKNITVQVQNVSKVCTEDNQVLNFSKFFDFGGKIQCPIISHFCQDTIKQCHNYCNGHGYCKDGSCECIKGFSGEFCEKSSQ